MTHRTPRFASLSLALGLFGCVSQARFDDTKTQLDQATEVRDAEKRRSAELETELAAAQEALRALEQRAAEAETAVDEERANLAQVRFESDIISREREDAKQMSEQLLSELDRVAGHLRAYADDKAMLDEQLEAARSRLAALALDEKANQQRFLAARELTLALAEPLEKKSLRLAMVDGDIAIQFPKQSAFDDGATLTEAGKEALEKAVRVLGPLALDIQVEQPSNDGDGAARAKTVSDALVRFGLAKERVIVAASETPAAAATAEAASAATPGEDTSAEATDSAASESDSLEEAPLSAATEAAESTDTELELRLRFPSSES